MSDSQQSQIDERVRLLKEVTLKAGQRAAAMFHNGVDVRKKGEIDLITAADEACEQMFVEAIGGAYPQDHMLGEESGAHLGSNQFQWIIDPIDGTTNFAHGLPHFSISAALSLQGHVVAGFVLDPVKEELFEARLGEGARLNGEPMSVGDRVDLGECLVATGFPYSRRQNMPRLLQRVNNILTQTRGLRRLGSAALDLAYVAAGRYDIFFEDGLNPWDIAAGQLLVQEAGGMVCGFDGEPLNMERGDICASNPALRPLVLRHLVERNTP